MRSSRSWIPLPAPASRANTCILSVKASGLLTASGFLAGATKPAGRALGIEALGRFYYLHQMQRDAPALEGFNLLQNPAAAVRRLATRVLAGEASFPLAVDNRRYWVSTAAVPVAGWHLVELQELP